MRKSKSQPLIDSYAVLTYLNLIPPATERCQRFLMKDFLYTQIIQVVSQRMKEKFWLESVFYMASQKVQPTPSLVSAQAESHVLSHLRLNPMCYHISLFFLCNFHPIHLYLSSTDSFSQSFHHSTSICPALTRMPDTVQGPVMSP